MQNTQIAVNPSPTVGNVDSGMTEGGMGRLGNFNEGVNGNKTTLRPPKATKADITSDIR